MQVEHPVCCGIDVHKDTLTACLRRVEADGQVSKEGREFATTYTSLLALSDWLVEQHMERHGSPPDFFTAGGMSAALAVAQALENADDWDTETLIATMQGMSWETPKGTMTFRAEDHQALQSMYHFQIEVDDDIEWAIPRLVREITPDEMDIPVGRNNLD
jgi:ABC-type branched-subunit amino acid transport system substrate-binding protein